MMRHFVLRKLTYLNTEHWYVFNTRYLEQCTEMMNFSGGFTLTSLLEEAQERIGVYEALAEGLLEDCASQLICEGLRVLRYAISLICVTVKWFDFAFRLSNYQRGIHSLYDVSKS